MQSFRLHDENKNPMTKAGCWLAVICGILSFPAMAFMMVALVYIKKNHEFIYDRIEDHGLFLIACPGLALFTAGSYFLRQLGISTVLDLKKSSQEVDEPNLMQMIFAIISGHPSEPHNNNVLNKSDMIFQNFVVFSGLGCLCCWFLTDIIFTYKWLKGGPIFSQSFSLGSAFALILAFGFVCVLNGYLWHFLWQLALCLIAPRHSLRGDQGQEFLDSAIGTKSVIMAKIVAFVVFTLVISIVFQNI